MDDNPPGTVSRSSCPHCGVQVESGKGVECRGCGLVFAKWRPKAAPASGAVPAAEATLEHWQGRRLRSGLQAAAWFTAALLLAWAAVKPPGGLPVPKDALQDPALGFAVSLPPGWKVLRRDVARSDTLLAVEAAPESADAWLQAVVIEGDGLPDDLAPGERGGLPQLLGAAFPDGAEMSYTRPTRVRSDNLKALRLEGGGNRKSSREVQSAVSIDPWVQRLREQKGLPPTPVEYVTKVVQDSKKILFVVQAVPGAGRRFAVGVIGEDAAFLARRGEIEAFLDSFRVTRRPLSPEHLLSLAVATLKGEFIQESILAAIVLLWALSRYLFSPLGE